MRKKKTPMTQLSGGGPGRTSATKAKVFGKLGSKVENLEWGIRERGI